MPYIKKQDRISLDANIKELARNLWIGDMADPVGSRPRTKVDVGKFNYVITKLIVEVGFDPSYAEYNAIIGALECCKLEVYRRAVAAYEDEKIKENGDVYPGKKEPSDGYDH